jgi:hypothetical protein
MLCSPDVETAYVGGKLCEINQLTVMRAPGVARHLEGRLTSPQILRIAVSGDVGQSVSLMGENWPRLLPGTSKDLNPRAAGRPMRKRFLICSRRKQRDREPAYFRYELLQVVRMFRESAPSNKSSPL